MKRVALTVAGVAASLAVAGPAAAYVPFRSDAGNVYHWPYTCVPMVAYPNDLVGMMPLEEIMAAVDASARAWSSSSDPCTALQITATRSTAQTPRAKNDGTNNIIFRTMSWCALTDEGECNPLVPPYDPVALALTSVSAGTTSGIIRDVDLEVNAFGFRWADLVAHPNLRGMSLHDLQNALTHEMGHVIGLTHTCFLDPPPLIDDMGLPTPDCGSAPPDVMATTMFPSADPEDIEKRTLDADDQRAVCEIYPAVPGRTACTPATMDDGCAACATAGASTPAMGCVLMLAATLAALRARRRCARRGGLRRRDGQVVRR